MSLVAIAGDSLCLDGGVSDALRSRYPLASTNRSALAEEDALQQRPLTWLPNRTRHDLNGVWRAIIDVYDVGVGGSPFSRDPRWGFAADRGIDSPGRRAEYDFDLADAVDVPGDWNTQRERWHFYEGVMWFRRRFEHTPATGRRQLLHFGAVNHHAVVYLNGAEVGQHTGGYGPFDIDVTDALRRRGENSLVVRVDNTRRPESVPTTHTDWFNYGGILRDVTLVDVPETFIRDAVVQLDPADGDEIVVDVLVDGPESSGRDVVVRVGGEELGTLRTAHDGHGSARFPTPEGLTRWQPGSPALHEVEVSSGTDVVSDRIGFRTVTTSGSRILVNGEPVFLAGISVHDEAIGEPTRRIRNVSEAHELLAHAVSLGANYVRLAHYQHHEATVRACDELGLLAWCEIPVYWGIDWANPATFDSAESQLTELIVRDRNRAAVILWSVANETRDTPERSSFLSRLVRTARELDPTRLITAALFSRPADGDFRSALDGTSGADWVIDDPLGEELDVLGVNQYHGWYYGSFDTMSSMAWTTPYDKPLVMSEFGAGARFGRRGRADESWTEDHQSAVYRHQFAMLARIPFLAGTSPWILKDFRAPFRVLGGVQDGFNRKGLIDPQGHHKLAYDDVREWNRSRTGSSGS